jgi:hypothetical protein
MGLSYINSIPVDESTSANSSNLESLRARIYPKLKDGYSRLTSYKTKENGYEWFGDSPPHEGLSAYGLM